MRQFVLVALVVVSGCLPPGKNIGDYDGDGAKFEYNCPYGSDCSENVVGLEDCDDTDPGNYPGNEETCDGQDNDCDLEIDEWGNPWYSDADGDGYGDPDVSISTCEVMPADSGYVTNADDCDDTDDTIYLGAPETCDDQDNNCNHQVDESLGVVWHPDADGDGHGSKDAALGVYDCVDPSVGGLTYTLDSSDCNDTSATINPDADEVCENGFDDDCDGQVDEPRPECVEAQ